MDFFPPNEILKLFCIVSTFTCFPGSEICVLVTVVVLDGTIVLVITGVVIVCVLTEMMIFVTVVGSAGFVEGCGGVEGWILECVAGVGHIGKPCEQSEW